MKGNIRNADERQNISQISVINVNDQIKHLNLKKIIDTIIKYMINFVFCVLLFSICVG